MQPGSRPNNGDISALCLRQAFSHAINPQYMIKIMHRVSITVPALRFFDGDGLHQ